MPRITSAPAQVSGHAVPNSRYLDHIPQLWTIARREVDGGAALAPLTPGPGIDWGRDAIDDRRVH